MDEKFDIAVTYANKQLLFSAQFISFGWVHKIEVDIYGTSVSFEKDEEGAWRAFVSPVDLQSDKRIDTKLLEAVVHAIEVILQ